MRRTKLIVDFELVAKVIGIVTSLKDYKLAWSINQHLKINLVMQPSLAFEFIKGKNLSVVNFNFKSEARQIRLIKNRGIIENSGYLIPELLNFDFFLMINEENNRTIEGEVEYLSTIEEIVYCKLIDLPKLKSKDNFIF